MASLCLMTKISSVDLHRVVVAPDPPRSLSSLARFWQELCRAGCSTFCVAPGSRSSPLAAAAAAQPRARLVPCIDERSLAFWALGHGAAAALTNLHVLVTWGSGMHIWPVDLSYALVPCNGKLSLIGRWAGEALGSLRLL